jgi:hypothetical protein
MAVITRNEKAVKFQKGTAAQYKALSAKDNNTFYYVSDSGAEQLYLGSLRLANERDITTALQSIATNENDIASLQDSLKALTGGESGSVQSMIDAAVETINNKIGDLSSLATTEKTTLVGAINEVNQDAQNAYDNSKVTLEESVPSTGSYAKIYTLKQGTDKDFRTIGTINIPKDMVVQSGTVETNPSGQTAGTYLVLTLANATSDKVYINVGTLIDIYTAASGAKQVQVAIDSSTREISASLVAGSVGTNELADQAITAAKVKTGSLTASVMDTDVQTALTRGTNSVQGLASGSAKGTIGYKAGGSTTYTDVKVTGLGSAAYEDKSYFEDKITEAQSTLQTAINDVSSKATTNANDISALTTTVETNKEEANSAITQMGTDTYNSALEAAKAYADGLAPNYATASQGALADTALQYTTTQKDITTGKTNGTIAVKGTDVAVKGLGSAAYTDSTAYDAAGVAETKASSALKDAKAYSDTNLTTAKTYAADYAEAILSWGEIA